ncbi:response regulator [Pedobacter faecalis]|uniref:response regulator n=1 Tax=Pedobacter faecalis TaxID=3041495 RepID=UPI00254B2BA3|nr:response regulator [Pedobacter sp. ELA7]
MVNLSFKQQVFTGFAISLLFVLLSAITSYVSIDVMKKDIKWQTHTYDVINLVKEVETQVLNAETGMRGYVIAKEKKYLIPYNNSADKILPTVKKLRQLIQENPEQVRLADSLYMRALDKVNEMKLVLKLHEEQGSAASSARVMSGTGQLYKNRIFNISQRMISEEYKLLAKRTAATESSSKRSGLIVLVSALIIFGLILFLFSYIKRTFDQQKLTEEHIRESNLRLEKISADNEQKNWLLRGAGAVNVAMRGEQELNELGDRITTAVCKHIEAQVGCIFVSSGSGEDFTFSGGYACNIADTEKVYHMGEGYIGQCARDQQLKILSNLPSGYLNISSGLGQTDPRNIVIVPVLFQNKTIAIIELGMIASPDEAVLAFLNNITENIGIALNSAMARIRMKALFDQTQSQAEELECQQEELRTANEELTHKSEQLQASEEELRVQQEELRQTNAELEEKARQLEEQNLVVNQAREAMSLKARELELSSQYKSEFLANMSHELRTPLNSILILAKILKENRSENLNNEQIKYAGVIHNAGSELLTLINDILDLSKIESGKIELSIEQVPLQNVKSDIESLFTEVANSKKIKFNTSISPDLPTTILTDDLRLQQIIKNLLSNAFKFTPEEGEISLNIGRPEQTEFFSSNLSNAGENVIAFSVKDTGIGISHDKQQLIFEAFKQADGSTSRKYGGTGLGLSISKELAFVLGGELRVMSEPGKGSIFTLYLPETAPHQVQSDDPSDQAAGEMLLNTKIHLEHATQQTPQVRRILIIEDDQVFADILKSYAEERGFEAILAHSGDEGLNRAQKLLPDAIILDIMLPVMDGWTVLKKLKSDPATKHIPVHIMSAGDEKENLAQQKGAVGFLKKPVEKEELDVIFSKLTTFATNQPRKVLLIEDQEVQSEILARQLQQREAEVYPAYTGKEALELLSQHAFDCIILDLKLPDISGFDLLDQIKAKAQQVPVVINTSMELTDDQMTRILKYTDALVLKSSKSNDRIIDEISLFMNKLDATDKFPSSTKHQQPVSTLEKALKNKKILIADDDMRNIFALSSALQGYELQIAIAHNGVEAIRKLKDHPDTDLVLMDIMMPEMDGYEAMRTIRADKTYERLPIIALTAKAMKSDRDKCLEAGANDYISKPVDIDKLVSMLRVWLS